MITHDEAIKDLISRVEALEALVSNKKKKQKIATENPFNFEYLYQLYPARLGTQNYVSAYSRLKKTVKTQEQYDTIKCAIVNYSQVMTQDGSVGTEYVMSFYRFVTGAYVEWTDKALTPSISVMTDEELHGI